MLRVAFVLRSTEVHPEFCGLSFPFFHILACYLATGVVLQMLLALACVFGFLFFSFLLCLVVFAFFSVIFSAVFTYLKWYAGIGKRIFLHFSACFRLSLIAFALLLKGLFLRFFGLFFTCF